MVKFTCADRKKILKLLILELLKEIEEITWQLVDDGVFEPELAIESCDREKE